MAQDHPPALDLLTTDVGEGDVFEQYMLGYEKVFTLPEESETREGFIKCLRLNHGRAYETLSRIHGPFREIVAVASLSDTGIIGGANFLVGTVIDEKDEIVITVHINYVHVDPVHRRSGRLRQIIDAIARMASTAFTCRAAEVVMFLELNDPLAMPYENYQRDSLASGIDQIDRVHAWTRIGARMVDHPYVQPALSEGKESEENLILATLTSAPTIPRRILHDHLRRFFAVSVAKGGEIPPCARRQLEEITADGMTDPYVLLDLATAIAELRRTPRSLLPSGTLREHVKRPSGERARHQNDW